MQKTSSKKIKLIKILINILLIIQVVFLPIISSAEFYDIEYGPDSKGMADYTDEAADAESKNTVNEKKSSDYVGKSSNNYLKSLSVENATISPEFNKQYTDYVVTLKEKNLEYINIIAEADDNKATITGIGKIKLEKEKNNLQVVVRAENGDVQIYNLQVEIQITNNDIKEEPQKEEQNILEEIGTDDTAAQASEKERKWIYYAIGIIIVIIIISVIIKKNGAGNKK